MTPTTRESRTVDLDRYDRLIMRVFVLLVLAVSTAMGFLLYPPL